MRAQASLPLTRTTWSATPTGWTDTGMGTYTSALGCDGNSNRGRMDNTGDQTQVFFSGTGIQLSFDLQGNAIGATSSLLVEESADGTTWTTLATISNIAGTCVTYSYNLTCATTAYVRWTYTKVTGNLAIDNVSITTGTCGGGGGTICPLMTGAVLNSCNNPGCNEGDAEILLFNSGSYSITVSSFPSQTVKYHGNTTNYNNNTVDAYTGTVSSNTATTAGLNGTTGCSGGFVDAVSAGTIPAYSTFIMVPSSFCYANYDFSNLCANFSPIYVVYFATTGWNTSGNMANYQAGVNPKYLVADFSWVAGCSKEYYTYDAGQEYSGGAGSGDGASVAFPQPASTASASPTAPSVYNGAGSCSLPLILPVDLLSFTVKRTYLHEAELSFTTIAEENIREFIISKSYDGKQYEWVSEHIAKNQPAGTNYLAYDKVGEYPGDMIYYRLAEKDLNGITKIIGNCVLELKPSKEITVAQSETELLIDTPGGLNLLEMYGPTGQLVHSARGNEEILRYTIEKSNRQHGIYLVSMIDLSGKVFVKKIVL